MAMACQEAGDEQGQASQTAALRMPRPTSSTDSPAEGLASQQI